MHFHDTYGQALANTMTALRHGVTVVDASTGGLGGCPYAKSATGNLATEDLVWALDGAGVETGVDLAALVETSVWMAGQLGRPSPSRRRAGARRRRRRTSVGPARRPVTRWIDRVRAAPSAVPCTRPPSTRSG